MKFQDIPGHENVKERLRAMIDNGRMPHALVLEGPAGTGKFALVRAAVQYLHCTDRRGGDSCGVCPSCIQHQSFNHIDTIYSFPVLKSAGGALSDDFIDRWRELSFTSHAAGCKVVMMWLPEKMNTQCANKLLKLIEEPLPGVALVFVSDNPGEILPTIYSRLQRVEVKRFADAEIARYLQERYNLESAEAMALAHNASGSITLAEKNMAKDDENNLFLEFFQQLMRLAYQRKIGLLKKWSQEISALGREQSARFCDYCQRQVRENFIANMRIAGLNYQTLKEQAFSRNFSPFINERNVEQLTSVFTKAREDIAANGNGKIIFFDVAVKVILLLKL